MTQPPKRTIRETGVCISIALSFYSLGSTAMAQTAPPGTEPAADAPATDTAPPSSAEPAPAGTPEAAPVGTPKAAPAAEVTPDAAATPEATAEDGASDSASQASDEVAALEARIADLEAKAEEAEMAALLGDESDADAELDGEPALKLYGFADFGVQRAWTDPSTPIANFIEANSTSFVIGNLNLYLDAKPIEAWRTMIEIRFTNAPLGRVNSPGGLAGNFDREDTYQVDPHGSGLNVPMWGGTLVLERAWTEWQAHQLFNLRVGNFFTPWGIWNIDHGSPVLITLQLPQSILQYIFPIRQTGLQIYGSTFAGDWQLGYHATISNGRNELNNYDFDDDKAFGARLFARSETGAVNLALGVSGYFGNQEDEVVNLTSISPLTFEQESTWEYDERIFGLDVSLDYDDFRVRSEFTARTREYKVGKSEPADPLFAPAGSFDQSGPGYWAYLIVAQRLPWLGLEPLIFVDGQYKDSVFGDLIVTPAIGLNVHFAPGTLLKLSYSKSLFFKVSNKEVLTDIDGLSVDSAMARIVTAF